MLKREMWFRPVTLMSQAEIIFLVRGDAGAVQFLVLTGWYKGSEVGEASPTCRPAKGDNVGYHSPTMIDECDFVSECDILPTRKCYFQANRQVGKECFTILLEQGDKKMWERLEQYYKDIYHSED